MTRLETVLALIESPNSELRLLFQQRVREILTEVRSVDLFAESGLHPRQGLWSEVLRRMIEELLPSAREDTDLSKLVFRIYPTSKSIERLIALPDETFERLARLISPVEDASAWAVQREDLTQAFLLLGVHVAVIGLSPALRARSHIGLIEESPSTNSSKPRGNSYGREARHLNSKPGAAKSGIVVKRCSTCTFAWRTPESAPPLCSTWERLNGPSPGWRVLPGFDLIAEPHQAIAAVKRLLDDVMNARREEMSVRALVGENTALMARKVVERSGKAGEHYIANSRKEYRAMWLASLGGGLLTVLTAAIKMRVVEANLPPFVEAMAAGTNYAVSFIVLQQCHFALATKQPSVTAAAFAGIVRNTSGKARLEEVAEFVSRITRSQLASAAGNLLAVGLGCIVFANLWVLLFSRPYLEASSAEHVYETLNPWGSGTVIYAALTGVILWVSALAGGWFENFATFNHLSAAIIQHPWGRKLGRERMKRLAHAVDANLSGWTTSIVLGYLLGFVPEIGRFFGFPLDVRHVTLSTGTLALAAASFGRDWLYRGWFTKAIFGIAVIFVLNLGVSFAIAAAVAMKAYNVSKRDQLRLLRYTAASFLRSPRRFLILPAKSDRREQTDIDV